VFVPQLTLRVGATPGSLESIRYQRWVRAASAPILVSLAQMGEVPELKQRVLDLESRTDTALWS